MAQAKSDSKPAKKAAPRTRKAPVATVPVETTPAKTPAPKTKAPSTKASKAPAAAPRTPAVRKARPRVVKKTEAEASLPADPEAAPPILDSAVSSVEAAAPIPEAAVSITEAQLQVVASKFASAEPAPAKPPRRTLPSTYGESRLLLLVRDPQTLFAAWDVSPSTIETLRGRLGRRGFAVSTQTLHLTRADGNTSVVHAGKKARSRYVKVEGGPSFVAEIGFTTPAGRFEFVARSAPCFVPMGPVPRSTDASGRTVLGYRAVGAMTRRAGLLEDQAGAAARDRAQASKDGSAAAQKAHRVLGGASDLYRR